MQGPGGDWPQDRDTGTHLLPCTCRQAPPLPSTCGRGGSICEVGKEGEEWVDFSCGSLLWEVGEADEVEPLVWEECPY